MSDREIPLAFVLERTSLTWTEVLAGLREGWLAEAVPIEIAMCQLQSGSDETDVCVLASLIEPNVEMWDLVERLASNEPQTKDAAYMTWLRILMSLLYEKRDDYDNCWDIVDSLYAEFGYPKEIAHLVSYFAPEDKDYVGGSPEICYEKFLSDWAAYVKNCF